MTDGEVREPPRSPLGLWASFGVTAAAIVITLAGGLAAAWLSNLESETARATGMGIALAAPYALTIVALWAIVAATGQSPAALLGLRPVPFRRVLALGVWVAVGARVLAAAWGVLLEVLGIELAGADIDPTALLPKGPIGIVFTVTVACVLAPVAEEMVFRGVLFPALARRWGAGFGTAVSAGLFAAIHVYPFAIPPIFVLAIVLARLYVRSGSLWVPIAAHALFNGIGIGAVYLLRGAGAL